MNTRVKEWMTIGAAILPMVLLSYIILQISDAFVMHGMKYTLMSMHIAYILTILSVRSRITRPILKTGLVLALLMLPVNVHMGMAIAGASLTANLLSEKIISRTLRRFLPVSLFTMATTGFGLIISRYFIGGSFSQITWSWILLASMISFILGWLGCMVAGAHNKQIDRYMALRNEEP